MCREGTHSPCLTPPLGPSAYPQDMAAVRPCLGRVLPGSSILFLCDMQEKFRHIMYFPQIVSVAARMLKVQVLPPSDPGCSPSSLSPGVQAPSSSLGLRLLLPLPGTGGPAAGGASHADRAVPTRPGPHSA